MVFLRLNDERGTRQAIIITQAGREKKWGENGRKDEG
jgi:hypothetical protein